jgi:hypothetical protein
MTRAPARCILGRVGRSWEELDALFGTQVARVAPLVDRPDEVWARVLDRFTYRLVVWRDGRVIEPRTEPWPSPVSARRLLLDLARQLVVEREVHDDGMVVRRAMLSGPLHESHEPPGSFDLDQELERDRRLGFCETAPWSAQPFGRVHRQYMRGREVRVISIDGDAVCESGGKRWSDERRRDACGSPKAAIAIAEQRITEHLRSGFRLRVIELLEAERRCDPPPFTPSADPYTAVDAAVERARRLAREQPRGHFLIEDLDPAARPADAERVREHGLDDAFFEQYRARLGRWAKLLDVPRTGSSLAYFFARYGSLTWVVSRVISDGLPMFHSGNASAGPWCCIELVDTAHDTSAAAAAYPGRGYERGRVFHGGWGGPGYILDTRVANAAGEHPIYPFSDRVPIADRDQMPVQPIEPSAIEPFGFWLERQIHGLIAELERRLPFVG